MSERILQIPTTAVQSGGAAGLRLEQALRPPPGSSRPPSPATSAPAPGLSAGPSCLAVQPEVTRTKARVAPPTPGPQRGSVDRSRRGRRDGPCPAGPLLNARRPPTHPALHGPPLLRVSAGASALRGHRRRTREPPRRVPLHLWRPPCSGLGPPRPPAATLYTWSLLAPHEPTLPAAPPCPLPGEGCAPHRRPTTPSTRRSFSGGSQAPGHTCSGRSLVPWSEEVTFNRAR